MQMPDVPNPIRDPERNVLYVVMAFRRLQRAELVQAVRVYQASRKARPKKGSTVTIISSIGHDER